jgi:hypothetical protein
VTASTAITTSTASGDLLRTYDTKREKKRTAAQKKALRAMSMEHGESAKEEKMDTMAESAVETRAHGRR